jgi:hypothetical protein
MRNAAESEATEEEDEEDTIWHGIDVSCGTGLVHKKQKRKWKWKWKWNKMGI